MNAMLDNFAETVGPRRDHGNPRGERFEAGVRKRVVNRRKNENVRRCVNRRKIDNFPEKLNALGLVTTRIIATSDEQTQFQVLATLDCIDGKAQSFSFPAGAG